MDGLKDILGIWVDEAEGAKFWIGICNDIKNRGVKEILIACMDGLKGLPQAIKTVFPTDESLNKCVYLATMEIMEKWTQPTPNWGTTLAELSIIFEEQLKDELA